jgi:hypothetical protein
MRFFDSRFFIKWFILVSVGIPKIDFEFCRIFMEIFLLEIPKNQLPAVSDSGESKSQP